MGAESAHPLVQKDLPTPVIDQLRKLGVLLLAELLLIGMGSPNQAPNIDSAFGCSRQDHPDFGSRPGKPLVAISPPFQEPGTIAGAQPGQLLVETDEVARAMNQG